MSWFFTLLYCYYHPSCHCHLAVNDECIDVHACGEVGGIDGDVCLAALGDGKMLYLLAAHIVDEDAGGLGIARNVERDDRTLAERIGLVLVHPDHINV